MWQWTERRAEAMAGPCRAIEASVEARGGWVTYGDGDGLIAVLGDSYAAGFGLDPGDASWPEILADEASASVMVDAIAATGYVNGGFCGGDTFSTRVVELVALAPDVLVIEGGLNDWEAGERDVLEAARAVLADVDAPEVIVVGPARTPARPDVAGVVGALSAAAGEAGATFVDVRTLELAFLADGLHPTPEGHRAFAAAVLAALH